MSTENKKAENKKADEPKDPLVLSISEHAKLSPAEREEFRQRYGTVSNQP